MQTTLKFLWKTGLIVFLLSSIGWLAGCEQLKEDELPEVAAVEIIELYALAGSPVVVDLMEGVNTPEAASVEMTEMPELGNIETLRANFSLYSPPAARTEGQTSFSWQVTTGNRTIRRQANMTISTRSSYPLSGGRAIYDRGGILDQGDSLVADILQNDLLPNGLSSVSNLEIVQAPIAGTAYITSDLKLAFTAPTDTTGLFDVLYGLTTTDGRYGVAAARFAVE